MSQHASGRFGATIRVIEDRNWSADDREVRATGVPDPRNSEAGQL